MLTSHLDVDISRYGDFCAHDDNNNDTTDYFTPCACARGNYALSGRLCNGPSGYTSGQWLVIRAEQIHSLLFYLQVLIPHEVEGRLASTKHLVLITLGPESTTEVAKYIHVQVRSAFMTGSSCVQYIGICSYLLLFVTLPLEAEI